jgi:hypothetical protein
MHGHLHSTRLRGALASQCGLGEFLARCSYSKIDNRQSAIHGIAFMSIWSDTFKHTQHRPYPLPDRAWTMHMSWQELLFAHWPFPAETVRERIAAIFGGVPTGLEIDTFQGSCYLGVVPFRMARTGLRFWPTWLGPHTFEELNVRTYVCCPRPTWRIVLFARRGFAPCGVHGAALVLSALLQCAHEP